MSGKGRQGGWQLFGNQASPVSQRERLVSALGSGVGLLTIYLLEQAIGGAAPWLVFPIGASVVLVFAMPHGPLSQPWPVAGGHLISALIGIACAKLVAHPGLAAALAMALAIAAMHALRCVHPPGGATALVAVLGGEEVRALGFAFLVSPVLVNVLLLLTVAVAFNACFSWRRYPLALAPRPPEPKYAAIPHEDFVFALSQIESFVDVSEDDLVRIYDIATRRQRERDDAGVAMANRAGPT